MAPLSPLHRVALWIKRRTQPLARRRRRRAGTRAVLPHLGYATHAHLVLRGRVLARRPKGARNGGLLANLRTMLALFFTDELAGVAVRHGAQAVHSDAEGYFTLSLPRADRAPGWHEIAVQVDGCDTPVSCPVLVPDGAAAHMVISDIDDTVLRTGADRLWRNLWTTFTGSAATRHVFPDAVALLQGLSAQGRNPVYYVSSSPWNLHGFLEDVLWPAGLPRGPMLLRDLGLSETQFITSGHGDHKGRSIDRLMAANPDLPVILIGDTGQKDAQIYLAALGRHPGRVRAVLLRKARRDGAGAVLEKLLASGVETHVADSFVAEPLRALKR